MRGATGDGASSLLYFTTPIARVRVLQMLVCPLKTVRNVILLFHTGLTSVFILLSLPHSIPSGFCKGINYSHRVQI